MPPLSEGRSIGAKPLPVAVVTPAMPKTFFCTKRIHRIGIVGHLVGIAGSRRHCAGASRRGPGQNPRSLMGIWQAPLADYRVIEPSRSDRGLACQIDAFPELGAGCLRRDRRDLAGAAGTGNLFP